MVLIFVLFMLAVPCNLLRPDQLVHDKSPGVLDQPGAAELATSSDIIGINYH